RTKPWWVMASFLPRLAPAVGEREQPRQRQLEAGQEVGRVRVPLAVDLFPDLALAERVDGQRVAEAVEDPVLLDPHVEVLVALLLVVAGAVPLARRDELDDDRRGFPAPWQAPQAGPDDAVGAAAVRRRANGLLGERRVQC